MATDWKGWNFVPLEDGVARPGRNLLHEKQDELFRQWREHFAAWEWATRSLAAKANALPACRAPGTHAPDCECATL